MKKFIIAIIALVFVCGALSAPASACCTVNKEVHQGVTGIEVWDFKVILAGAETIIWHFDGYLDEWHFNSYRDTIYYDPFFGQTVTMLKWWNPQYNDDPDTLPIPYCDTVHIGYQVANPPANVLGAFWTDANQNPIIPQGYVRQPTHWVTPWPGPIFLRFYNDLYNAVDIYIDNIYYQIFSTGIPNDDLNDRNPLLDPTNMIPISGSYTITSGDSVSFEIPGVQENEWVVYRFDAEGEINFVEFGQHQVEVASIPTLPEWGLIILTMLLLATAVWLMRKRKVRMTPA